MTRRTALKIVALACGLDLLFGYLFALAEHLRVLTGIYWSLTTATTVGYGDVVPHTGLGHLIAALVMITVVPIYGSLFSLFTSIIVARHIEVMKDDIKQHVTDHIKNEGNHERGKPPTG